MTDDSVYEDDNVENFPEGEENLDAVDTAEIDPDPSDALKAEAADLKDKLLRAMAEMDNIRKRAAKDRDDAQKYGVANLAKELLAVADNLSRAVDAIPQDLAQESDAIANLITGIQATQSQLMGAMSKSGIKPIDAAPGTAFDPNIHEVMFEADAPEFNPGSITQVMETGYMIHDRLLRPARVGVAKKGNGPNQSHINVEA